MAFRNDPRIYLTVPIPIPIFYSYSIATNPLYFHSIQPTHVKVDILMNTVEDLAIKHGEHAIAFGTLLRRYREIQSIYDVDIRLLPYADSARGSSNTKRDPKVWANLFKLKCN